MTNTVLLKKIIKEKGLSITFLADKMNISRESLHNKVNNITEFKASEIVSISKLLGLTDEERDKIFFAS